MAQSNSMSGEYREVEVAAAESLLMMWRSRQPASTTPPPLVTVNHEERVLTVDSDVTKALREVVGDAIRRWRGVTAGAEQLAADTVGRISREAALATVKQLEAAPPPPQPLETHSFASKENIRRSKSLYVEDSEIKPCAKLIPIGEGSAAVPAYVLKTMDWKRHRQATRTLLEHVFGREVLATHNMTGKPSPAFPDRKPKGRLDPAMVKDIVQTVVAHSGVSASLVRSSITSKCADEGKGLHEALRRKSHASKKEN